VHLKSAFDDVIWNMEENSTALRFGLLSNVYMSCDSSFVKLATGLMLIVALGSPNEFYGGVAHVFELILS
jgi:hypothetical protein